MAFDEKSLGTLRPVGGGDPIPLKKAELAIGRRPTNNIKLDFENVSGKHCVLRFIKGVWHVRDLGSTNGTFINGSKIHSEHTVLPDDELAISSHLFRIDYEPSAPDSVINSDRLIDYGADLNEKGNRKSLLELAGLNSETGEARRGGASSGAAPARSGRSKSASSDEVRAVPDEEEMVEAVPDSFQPDRPAAAEISDDEFLNLFEDSK